jgi:hypothetical protein
MAMTNVYTGANGTLTLAHDNSPEGAQAAAVMKSYSLTAVGRVTDVEVCVHTDLRTYHEIGLRETVSLHAENIYIEGTVSRAYINGSLLFLLLGKGALPTASKEPYTPVSFNMTLSLNDPAVPGNKAALELQGVKFMSWSYKLPEDDFVMENVKFKALAARVVDKEGGGKAKAPAFPK